MKHLRRQDESRLRERRQRIAFEAARLMSQHGMEDFHQAKLKAARQLGIDDEASLPSNVEVQEQLREYQRLFHGRKQPAELRRRREAALQSMEFFAPFKPRLVGSVLDGTADANSPVCLQVFSEDADVVARYLLDARVPAGLAGEKRLRVSSGRHALFPAWRFTAEGLSFEVTVLPESLLRQAPLDEVDGRPMQRAGSVALRQLIEADRSRPDA